ncbi:MAG: sensor-containing diguanylate cyclase/phosphodiesterase [Acidimicrobiales bacterium]|nr:sensor-containing diguanylate cyclase/phosphodiesterase [Acidimicrobiales bacterium]
MSRVHGSREGRPRSLFVVEEHQETSAEEDLAAAPLTDFASSPLGRDVPAREMVAALLEHAVTDQLTGLPNRTLLRDRLVGGLARLSRSRSSLAVLFLDVDRFKVVNDSLGHTAGDELLCGVARRLREATRPADTLARFGGDEFVVVFEDVDELQAIEAANRLLEAFESPVMTEGRLVQTGVSIGIVLTDDPAKQPESLLRDADAAMYRAKERGGGRIELFDDAMRQDAVARLDLEGDLRRAIEGDELCMRFQPYVDISSDRIVGVEALIRWEHPTRGLVPPMEFIPVAEETGLIGPIGAWVLTTACQQLATWDAQGTGVLDLAVNVSRRQLGDPELVETVAATLSQTGIEPSRLCLEITESVLMRDAAAAAATLHRLYDLGVCLAVDDFGTGYSSLLYLRRFPVRVLKLDRLFVAGVGINAEDARIVRATIDLAHALGWAALAEGVERPEQLELLRQMRCDLAQGFLWSEPLAADEISELTLQPVS